MVFEAKAEARIGFEAAAEAWSDGQGDAPEEERGMTPLAEVVVPDPIKTAQLEELLAAQRRLAGAAREYAVAYDVMAEAKATQVNGSWTALLPKLLDLQDKLQARANEAEVALDVYAGE